MANPVPKPTKENRPKLNGLTYAEQGRSRVKGSDIYQNRESLYRKRNGLRINPNHDTD